MRIFALFMLGLLMQSFPSKAAVETYVVDRGRKSATITAAVDSKGVLHRGAEYGTKPIPWLDDRTRSVAAEYPYMERMRHHTGAGIFRIFVDLNTGSVTNVVVVKSTGFKRLDACSINSLRQWRWKPQTWKQIDMPVVFTIAQPPKRVPAGVEHIPKTS